ncbi:hypothetical protein MPSI1_001122 [Malassezia psittaci]|uniref:TEA domain-containing protein n=1 Tax=Malassezia psittaci TaxID=1821823 RepID=A0AAF0JD05_9BASI|nr:hypothetical protein MPSI1_001122 [Malassezia psittaci]
MNSFAGPGGSPHAMRPPPSGSPDETYSGQYGITPASQHSQSSNPGSMKGYPIPYNTVQQPHSVDALDLSMTPPYLQRLGGFNNQGYMEPGKPYPQPESLDGKRRRTSSAVSSNISPLSNGQIQSAQDSMGASQPESYSNNSPFPLYPIGLGVHHANSNPAYCCSPNMLWMPFPETPSSVASAPGGMMNQQNNTSPLAHRNPMHLQHGELSPMPNLVMHSQQNVAHSLSPIPPDMQYMQQGYYDVHDARRAISHSGIPPWPTPDKESFFTLPHNGRASGPILSPHAQANAMRPSMPQRQSSAPQPRAIRERVERKMSTDVWPDDVEVAFWEALRLIPKLGRRKVLVHGKPCGRNELIADYIERKTNKTRSRKQVSSHIQVLKNVKRNDPEFQQLIAEPVTEEDYYTPAGGMMYAQPLADYSSGLLGVSLLSAPHDSNLIVSPTPLSSASLSPNPNVMSPLPVGLSPRDSPAAGAIANALDNLHFTASPKTMFAPNAVSPQLSSEALYLSEIEPTPSVVPASFSMGTIASATEDKHVYAQLDSLALSQVLRNASPLPVTPSSASNVSHFRFPKLDDLQKKTSCPFFHVHVPVALPRLTQGSPAYDQFNVALSLASTRNVPLLSTLSIYSHSKCVLSMVEPLEDPRPVAARRSDSLNTRSPQPSQPSTPSLDASSGFESAACVPGEPSKSPLSHGQGQYRWSYQAPFASDFWADFLSRNHPVHMYGNGGLESAPCFSKEPSERAALGLAMSGVTLVQEFVLPHNSNVEAHTIPNPPDTIGINGSNYGEVLCVIAWELQCVEQIGKQPPVPTVSLIRNVSRSGVASSDQGAVSQRTSTIPTPSTPTPKPKTILGLQLQPANASLADPERLATSSSVSSSVLQEGANRNSLNEGHAIRIENNSSRAGQAGQQPVSHLRQPDLPRLTTTEPSPQAPTAMKRSSSPAQVPSSAMNLAEAVRTQDIDGGHLNGMLSDRHQSTKTTLSNFTNNQSLFAGLPSESPHNSGTLISTIKYEASPTSLAVPNTTPSQSSPQAPAPIRSNSMSMLDEHGSHTFQPTPYNMSATVNSLTDPQMSGEAFNETSMRLGLSSGQLPWDFSHDFMDAFLNNPTSDTVMVGGSNNACVSPTRLSFTSPQEINARSQPLDISLMPAL